MIIAYTSGSINPTSSQTDPQIDLSSVSLPVTSNLYGGAVDSADGAATFTFSWTLLRKPSGSLSVVSDSALQNPVLNAVDVWGNYRLFLIATNTSTGETSETDPILAPSSAFVTVRLLGASTGLQKLSAGERDWNDKAEAWVGRIETNKLESDAIDARTTVLEATDISHDGRITTLENAGAVYHDLDGLTDVTINIPTTGDALVYGGSGWTNAPVSTPTLTVQDSYGVDTTVVNLAAENLAVTSDGQSIVPTFGTITGFGTPMVNFEVAENQDLSNLTLTGGLTLNEDATANDPTIYFKRQDFNIPYISYDIGNGTFVLKRDNASGEQEIVTVEDIATSTAYGISRRSTSEDGAFSGSNRILNVERLIYSMRVDNFVDYKSDTQHNLTSTNHEIQQFDSANLAQIPIALFKNMTGRSVLVSQISLILASAGISNGVNEYAFNLVGYSSLANVGTDSRTIDVALPAFSRLSNNKIGECEWDYIGDNSSNPLEIPQGYYFGITVEDEPDFNGNGLQVNIEAFRLP